MKVKTNKIIHHDKNIVISDKNEKINNSKSDDKKENIKENINEIKHLKECLLGDKFENSPLNIKFAEITQRIIIKVLEKNNLINHLD